MQYHITTTYLEMTSQEAFNPKDLKNDTHEATKVVRIKIPSPALNHFFFVNVGRPWKWYSRLVWRFEDWQRWVENKHVSTWVGYFNNTPFGYFELEEQQSDVEISFFGILPQFLEMGLGGWFLSETVKAAWSFNPKRVWVHTCSFDNKYAVSNYINRGFSIYKKETKREEIPDEHDPIWLTPNFYDSLSKKYAHLFSDSLYRNME